MQTTDLANVQDPAVKKILTHILTELDRIKNLPPVTEDTKQLAIVVNKLTGNL